MKYVSGVRCLSRYWQEFYSLMSNQEAARLDTQQEAIAAAVADVAITLRHDSTPPKPHIPEGAVRNDLVVFDGGGA